VNSLQWGHGDEAVEEAREGAGVRRARMGFNGAMAMKPWKRLAPSGRLATQAWLQWGHGDEAVEELRLEASEESHQGASMGPRR